MIPNFHLLRMKLYNQLVKLFRNHHTKFPMIASLCVSW
uniref:Uncharacterized protein n=1 Tax=Myoviridae sp. ctQf419 TaxID=2825102 RepID=A0A8S5UKW7_9CAUD|nr:MAG TPA: hypothetical protein [Myoviridae sp. ctQf419]